MLCLFVVFMVTMLLVQILNSMTADLATIRNTIDYQRALYLANAGIHEAAARMEEDSTWRGTLTEGAYPADDTYTATATDAAEANTVTVTATGVAGDTRRSVTALLEL